MTLHEQSELLLALLADAAAPMGVRPGWPVPIEASRGIGVLPQLVLLPPEERQGKRQWTAELRTQPVLHWMAPSPSETADAIESALDSSEEFSLASTRQELLPQCRIIRFEIVERGEAEEEPPVEPPEGLLSSYLYAESELLTTLDDDIEPAEEFLSIGSVAAAVAVAADGLLLVDSNGRTHHGGPATGASGGVLLAFAPSEALIGPVSIHGLSEGTGLLSIREEMHREALEDHTRTAFLLDGSRERIGLRAPYREVTLDIPEPSATCLLWLEAQRLSPRWLLISSDGTPLHATLLAAEERRASSGGRLLLRLRCHPFSVTGGAP